MVAKISLPCVADAASPGRRRRPRRRSRCRAPASPYVGAELGRACACGRTGRGTGSVPASRSVVELGEPLGLLGGQPAAGGVARRRARSSVTGRSAAGAHDRCDGSRSPAASVRGRSLGGPTRSPTARAGRHRYVHDPIALAARRRPRRRRRPCVAASRSADRRRRRRRARPTGGAPARNVTVPGDLVSVYNFGALQPAVVDAAVGAAVEAGARGVRRPRLRRSGMVEVTRGGVAVHAAPGPAARGTSRWRSPRCRSTSIGAAMGRDVSALHQRRPGGDERRPRPSLSGAQAGDVLDLVAADGSIVPVRRRPRSLPDAEVGGTELVMSTASGRPARRRRCRPAC